MSGVTLSEDDLAALRRLAKWARNFRATGNCSFSNTREGAALHIPFPPAETARRDDGIYRMKVTQAPDDNDVLKAKIVYGTSTGVASDDAEFAVKSAVQPPHEADDIISAYEPRGGTDKTDDSGDPVTWEEIPQQPTDYLFSVALSKDGGSDGDASVPTACTYTYTATRNGRTYGTNLSPERGRLVKASYTVATMGIGLGTPDNFTLWDTNEVLSDQTKCT